MNGYVLSEKMFNMILNSFCSKIGFGLGFSTQTVKNPAQTKNSGFGLGYGLRSKNGLGCGF